MVDFNKLVGSITGSGLGSGLAGGVAGGALVSALTTKTGRNTAKSVAKIGGLAAVGALAWGAYKKYQSNNSTAVQLPEGAQAGAQISANSAPAGVAADAWGQLPQQQFDELASDVAASQGLLVLRTMIAAAMADGHLGPDEQKQIFERLDSLGLSAEERSTLFDELRNPLACDVLASQVSDPVVAIEMYTAAVMTIDTQCLTAGEFLRQLSRGLKLPEQLVASIDSSAAGDKLDAA
jgi:uncharacterized membrane protein YebE (DUF533 family)